MNAEPYLRQIAEQLAQSRLEAILIGNAAAALKGAHVTTVKRFCQALTLVIYRPIYPPSPMFRASRDIDQLQLDFHFRIAGIQTYERLRSRASTISFGGNPLLVACLADVIKSKRAANRPKDLAILFTLANTQNPRPKPARKRLNLKEQFEHMRLASIDASLALPPERSTNFLRKRIGICASAL